MCLILAAKGGRFPKKRKILPFSALSQSRFIDHSSFRYVAYGAPKSEEHRSVNPRIFLSVGRRNLDLAYLAYPFAQLVQLGCTANFERFRRILGYEFIRISCFLVSGFPFDMVEISGNARA